MTWQARKEGGIRQLAYWRSAVATCKSESQIVSAGNPGDCMYILSRGDAELFKGDEMVEKTEECH